VFGARVSPHLPYLALARHDAVQRLVLGAFAKSFPCGNPERLTMSEIVSNAIPSPPVQIYSFVAVF